MLRAIMTVGGWTMVSRVLGLVREMLMAAILGTGPVADAFVVALKLPNLFRRLFGEGAFNAAFVPAYSGMLAVEGREAAGGFAAEAMSLMLLWLGLLMVLGEIFMPQLMSVLAPGFAAIPSKFHLSVVLTRITFPYLPMICLAALYSGMLNGLHRFAAAAAAPVLFNTIAIAALLLFTPYLPTPGHALAIGVTVSGVAQLGLLVIALRRAGMPVRFVRPRLTPQMRVLLARMGPGVVGAGVTQLNFTIDVIIASLLPPGTVAVLNYADRLNQLPLGVIGIAVGTTLLPQLSRQVRGGEAAAASATTNRALEYALVLTIPAALALVVSSEPIISVLFGRGAFTAAAITRSAQALAAYAVGLPFFVLVKVLTPGYFARGDTATPVKIALGAVALNLALNLAFMRPLQHMGPPLATSLAAMFNVALLAWVLARRGHLHLDTLLRQRLPRMALAALAMAAMLYAMEHPVYDRLAAMGHGARWLGLALLVTLGMAAYFAVGQLIGAFDLRAVTGRMIRTRRKPVTAKQG